MMGTTTSKAPILILDGRVLRCQEWELDTWCENVQQIKDEWFWFGKTVSPTVTSTTLKYLLRGEEPQRYQVACVNASIERRRSGRSVIKCHSLT